MMPLAQQVLAAAHAHSETIVIAESCTGGLLTSALTDTPGASSIVDSGFVTYSYASKTSMLSVKPETLLTHGAVSSEVALEMAQGALRASTASLAIAITGVAGPQDSESKPAGTVWFAIVGPSESVSELVEFGAIGRDQVRKASVEHALSLLLRVLKLHNM